MSANTFQYTLVRYTHIHAYDLILGTELVSVRIM